MRIDIGGAMFIEIPIGGDAFPPNVVELIEAVVKEREQAHAVKRREYERLPNGGLHLLYDCLIHLQSMEKLLFTPGSPLRPSEPDLSSLKQAFKSAITYIAGVFIRECMAEKGYALDASKVAAITGEEVGKYLQSSKRSEPQVKAYKEASQQ